jgi:hypothetical protein
MENELRKKGSSEHEYIDYNNNLYQENEELRAKLSNEVFIILILDACFKTAKRRILQ